MEAGKLEDSIHTVCKVWRCSTYSARGRYKSFVTVFLFYKSKWNLGSILKYWQSIINNLKILTAIWNNYISWSSVLKGEMRVARWWNSDRMVWFTWGEINIFKKERKYNLRIKLWGICGGRPFGSIGGAPDICGESKYTMEDLPTWIQGGGCLSRQARWEGIPWAHGARWYNRRESLSNCFWSFTQIPHKQQATDHPKAGKRKKVVHLSPFSIACYSRDLRPAGRMKTLFLDTAGGSHPSFFARTW